MYPTAALRTNRPNPESNGGIRTVRLLITPCLADSGESANGAELRTKRRSRELHRKATSPARRRSRSIAAKRQFDDHCTHNLFLFSAVAVFWYAVSRRKERTANLWRSLR